MGGVADGSRGQIVPHILDAAEKALAGGAFLAGFGFTELAEQFLLPRGQLRRRFDVDLDHQIAVTAAVEHRHARAALAQLRSEEHTSELQSLMRISYAVFCLKKKQQINTTTYTTQ